MNKTHKYLIELIKTSLEAKDTIELDRDVNYGDLCKIARSHHVENIIYPLLNKFEGFSQSELGKTMNKWFMISLTKSETQTIQAEKIMEEFEKNCIKHIPLKGYLIKELYPSPHMRQSNDFDIYVPFEQIDKAAEIMDSLGYSYCKNSVGIGMHTEFKLGLFVEVEVHKSLMAPEFPKWCKLCEEIVANAKLKDGWKYRYEFSKEDYYLYMQLHTIKHLKFSSSGIKSIADIYIYLRHFEDILDWEYINNMLRKGNLLEIDKNLRSLSNYWFKGEAPENEIIYSLSDYIIDSGAFGTMEQYLSGRKTDETKVGRIIKTFFLPVTEMKIKYPILNKIPVLLPVMWVYRAIYGVCVKKEIAKGIITKGDDISKESANELSEFKKKIGF